jgi:16S rRNA (guanine527-N7)-methyltransferase
MDARRIAALVQPFLLTAGAESAPADPLAPAALTGPQLEQISAYLDLLLRWNERINLSAVRDAEEVVTRHFGESLFAARHLFPSPGDLRSPSRLIDVGSGSGFPGLPIKIWSNEVQLTLIESNQKKATFLREVIRRLGFKDGSVFSGRAENFPSQAEVVTLRAVERFETALTVATRLVLPAGRVALLIGAAQVERARELRPEIEWQHAATIPLSSNRVLMIGQKNSAAASCGSIPSRTLP